MTAVEIVEKLKATPDLIDKEMFDLMAENKEEIIPLLIKLIDDVYENPDEYIDWINDAFEKEEENLDNKLLFLPNAMFVLGEFGAEEAWDSIFRFISQGDYAVEFWFGDLFTECMWYVVAKLGRKHLSEIEEFYYKKEYDLYSRTSLLSSFVKMAIDGYNKEEIINIYSRFLKSDVLDAEEKGFVILDILNMGIIDEFGEEAMKVAKEIEGEHDIFDIKDLTENDVSKYYAIDTLEELLARFK